MLLTQYKKIINALHRAQKVKVCDALLGVGFRIRQLASLVRLTPFDTSTPEGLASERSRRAAMTTFTTVIAKGVSILTGFISVPLTLNYLGTERYGLWMTISSVIVMLSFADFGLGNGLVNVISQADGRNDHDTVQKAVSSVFFMLLGTAVLLLLIFGIIYPFVPWHRIFNVTSTHAVSESGPATAVFFACFALNMPLGIVQRVQFGYQNGFLNNYWQIGGNVLGLAAVVAAILLQGGLPWLVFAMSGVPAIVIAANWWFLFFYQRPLLLPRWKNFQYSTAKSLLGTGIIFMLLWMVNILGTSTDNIIIAQFLGASDVAAYAVVQRLFSLTFIVQFCTVPMWPAFSEALARSDFAWVRRTFNYGMALAVVLTVMIGLPLLLFARPIVKMWAGPLVIPSWSLVITYATFRLVGGINDALTPIMQTDLFVRPLLLIASVSGIASFVLKIIFVPIYQSAGVAVASVLGYGLFFTIPAVLIVNKELNRKRIGSK